MLSITTRNQPREFITNFYSCLKSAIQNLRAIGETVSTLKFVQHFGSEYDLLRTSPNIHSNLKGQVCGTPTGEGDLGLLTAVIHCGDIRWGDRGVDYYYGS